jgi:hypothetical protein
MWQVPNQKLRALMNARRRERDRNRRKFHIRRTQAQVKIVSTLEAPPVEDVRVVLNDISPKAMSMFSSHPIGLGQVAAITIEEPTRIYVRARVVSCQELDYESRVITEHPFSYRVGVVFLFDSEEEQVAFQSYCEQLASEVLGTARLKAA